MAESFARELVARVPPDELAKMLRQNPELIPPILRNLGTALMGNDPRLPLYVAAVARTASVAGMEMPQLAAIILIDPLRYREDTAFRARMNALLPRTFAKLPHAQARALLEEPTPLQEIDFDTLDALAVAPRSSGTRRAAFVPLQMPDDSSAPIEASIYSLNSAFFTTEEAQRFLDAVHRASPKRRLIVLADAPMRLTGVTLLDNHARPFTPWTRDPFIVARTSGGGVVFVNSPNVQQHRDEDRNMTRAIVQELPSALDTAWKHPQWTVAPLPFHNGHILLTPSTVWISI
ncbi:MAG TPA: hypothetical protein VKL19_14000, partial [Thermoanaerobaculia bacterium]|nr:hypothetical protein [Thermoanaerobaculia bacterium]